MTTTNRNRALNPRILGIIILVLTLLTVGQNIYYARQQAEQVRCQTEFISKYTSALQVRSDVSAQDRTAVDVLVTDITNAFGTGDSEAVQEALNRYTQTRLEAEAERAKTPYPDTTLSEECVTP